MDSDFIVLTASSFPKDELQNWPWQGFVLSFSESYLESCKCPTPSNAARAVLGDPTFWLGLEVILGSREMLRTRCEAARVKAVCTAWQERKGKENPGV